ELQKDHKLVVNGIADEVTLDKINHLNTPLKKGMRHADVKALKKDLAKLGFKVPGNGTNLYGTKTEKKVKELQKYYGIKQTGTVNNQTKKTIDTNVNSPLQKGKRHKDTKKLKKDLKKIGYTVPGNGTNLYGTKTANKIKELQKDYKLVVNGIADEVTLERIAKLTKKSNYKTEYTNYNLSLNDALNIQMDRPIVITDKYGKDPAYVSANYLRLTGQAKVSGLNVNIRTAPNSKKNNIAFTLKKNEKITITGTKTGSKISGSTLWYQFSKKGKKYYIHSSLATGAKAKATATVNVRAGKGSSYHTFGQLKKGDIVNIKSQGASWHEIEYTAWREPKRADMKAYLDPSKNDKFQHLRLDSRVGVSATELNKALKGEGVIEGQGKAFINGAKKYGVNEAYLISHAFLETGHGTSKLAKGVKYKGKTVYNMFGIGAVDSDPLNGGAKTAYENGWFTPAK